MPKVFHFDLAADDLQRAMDFYKEVYNWQFEKWDDPMEYWLIEAGPEEEAGIGGGLAPRNRPGVIDYIPHNPLQECRQMAVFLGLISLR